MSLQIQKSEARASLRNFLRTNLIHRRRLSATILTRLPFLSNCTLPSLSANRVQSLPMPTFLPATNLAAALADNDASGGDKFAAKRLHAQPFADAVASVANAALTFFMCHKFFFRRRLEAGPASALISLILMTVSSCRCPMVL